MAANLLGYLPHLQHCIQEQNLPDSLQIMGVLILDPFYSLKPGAHDATLSPFSTRRICSRDAKRKQEFSNVIGWRSSERFRQPITLVNSCFRFASREQIRLVENGL